MCCYKDEFQDEKSLAFSCPPHCKGWHQVRDKGRRNHQHVHQEDSHLLQNPLWDGLIVPGLLLRPVTLLPHKHTQTHTYSPNTHRNKICYHTIKCCVPLLSHNKCIILIWYWLLNYGCWLHTKSITLISVPLYFFLFSFKFAQLWHMKCIQLAYWRLKIQKHFCSETLSGCTLI